MLNKFSLDDVCETVVAFPTNVAVFKVEANDRFVLRAMSPGLIDLYKTSAEVAIGMEVDEFRFDAATRTRLRGAYMECWDSLAEVIMEEELVKPGGFRVFTSRTIVPVLDPDGAAVALISTVNDISELVTKRRVLVRTLSAMASGFETICAWCRKIRNDDAWITLDQYVKDHKDSDSTVCPQCRNRKNLSWWFVLPNYCDSPYSVTTDISWRFPCQPLNQYRAQLGSLHE